MSATDDDDFELGVGPDKPWCIVCGETCDMSCPDCEAGLCHKLGCRELHSRDCTAMRPDLPSRTSESEF